MAANVIDLSLVPAPTIVETLDFETIVSDIQADLIARGQAVGIDFTPVLALESEPTVKLIEAAAYREMALRAAFNARAQQDMLAYAVGSNLDNLVANFLVLRKAGETDPALLARAILAPSGWSVAGPLGAYEYLALSADPTVSDVAVSSPAPCQVRVVVLSTATDGVADAGLLATVSTALNASTVRPYTDQVTVASATVATYDVTATIYVLPGPDASQVLAAATAAVQAYAANQRRINRKVTLHALGAAIMQPGVDDYALTSPTADLAAAAEVAPVLGTLTLTVSVEAASG